MYQLAEVKRLELLKQFSSLYGLAIRCLTTRPNFLNSYGCGGWNRTSTLKLMRLASNQYSTPQIGRPRRFCPAPSPVYETGAFANYAIGLIVGIYLIYFTTRLNGSGGWGRTNDLLVNSQAHYHSASHRN
jgi:hypothetical protein